MITLNNNEFYTGLANMITVVRTFATNTSNKQRDIVESFATETLYFGDTKAYWFASIPKVEDYNPTSSLLTPKPTTFNEEFISGIIKKKIPLTTVEPFIRQVMLSESDVQFFTAYLNGLMSSAKDKYLYDEIMSDILNWTPTVTSADKEMKSSIELIDTASAKSVNELLAIETRNQNVITKGWQKIFDDFQIFTDVFIDVDNKKGTEDETHFETALKLSDLVFIGNAKYLNDQVVDQMATLLNSSVIDKNFQSPPVLKIPERTMSKYNADKCVGFVAHKKWYQWYYNFNFTGAFLDIDNLNLKRVMHFWYTKGVLKNLPVLRLDATYKAFTPATR